MLLEGKKKKESNETLTKHQTRNTTHERDDTQETHNKTELQPEPVLPTHTKQPQSSAMSLPVQSTTTNKFALLEQRMSRPPVATPAPPKTEPIVVEDTKPILIGSDGEESQDVCFLSFFSSFFPFFSHLPSLPLFLSISARTWARSVRTGDSLRRRTVKYSRFVHPSLSLSSSSFNPKDPIEGEGTIRRSDEE